MSTAEALSLMLNFGMFMLTLLMFIDKHHDKLANQKPSQRLVGRFLILNKKYYKRSYRPLWRLYVRKTYCGKSSFFLHLYFSMNAFMVQLSIRAEFIA